MVKPALIIFTALVFAACSSTRNTTHLPAGYFQQPPDLSTIVYAGGNGTSIDSAVIIKNAGNEKNGVAAEYAYISKLHGERSVNWKFAGQSTGTIKKKKIDVVYIQTIPQQVNLTYYFDITDFYGKL